MLPHGTVLALGALATFAAPASAGEKPDPPKKGLTAAQCERLVEQLANQAGAPFRQPYVMELPEGVTNGTLRERQQKIAAAYNKLSDNFESALPVLVQHVNDRRFSYVYEDGVSGVYEKATVGDACRRIVEAHVEVYHEHVRGFDETERARSLWFLEDRGGVKKWWKGRQGNSLAELQREGIEWVLRQKRPGHFRTEEEWAAAKKALEKMAADVRDSGKPIRVKHTVLFFSK
jgi:hypothetical protein